jgi:murein DD-endopeptidase MepM/ murein hydrolase activator NlpD
VIAGPTEFYGTTYAIEIDHGEFLVRYGEIRKFVPVRKGDSVVAGQRIAMVGHLVGISVPSDMLHFEMYSKAATGPLTVRDENLCGKRADGVPFYRRSDLLDPTQTLNRLAELEARRYEATVLSESQTRIVSS